MTAQDPREAAGAGQSVETYRIRWTVAMDLVAMVDAPDEDTAYDMAVDLGKERLEQVAVTLHGVALHGDIDGCAADEVERVTRPTQDPS